MRRSTAPRSRLAGSTLRLEAPLVAFPFGISSHSWSVCIFLEATAAAAFAHTTTCARRHVGHQTEEGWPSSGSGCVPVSTDHHIEIEIFIAIPLLTLPCPADLVIRLIVSELRPHRSRYTPSRHTTAPFTPCCLFLTARGALFL